MWRSRRCSAPSSSTARWTSSTGSCEAELDAAGQRQRFVASLRRDPAARHGYRAEIKMQRVGPESPFFWISGTENVTVVRSEYSAPLVIKGAGEGVRLAATGIIKDILM